MSAVDAVARAILVQIRAHADMVVLPERLNERTVATSPYEEHGHSIYRNTVQKILADDDNVIGVYKWKYANTIQTAIIA